MLGRRLAATLLALVSCGLVVAVADTWLPPETKVYESADHHLRFTVTPRDIANPLGYFDGQVKHENLPGQRPGSPQTFARGVLVRVDAANHQTMLWDRHLVNDVAPVEALVSNSGRFVVTFDDWFFVGTGDHVVVIYGEGGSIIRVLTLADILPADYIEALPRTASSLWWGGEHQLAEERGLLILKIKIPTDDPAPFGGPFVDLPVELATGRVRPSNDAAWQHALGEASRVAKAKREAMSRADAEFRAPLLGPTSTEDRDWHDYLVEAFFRLDPEWDGGYPATQVLRGPGAADYAPSEGWLRDRVLEAQRSRSVIMIASPASPPNLIKVLTAIVREGKPNGLIGSRIYVAVPVQYRDEIAAAIAPSGAAFIYLNPTKPIPQRKARLERRFGIK
jgi:hypothetical protein